MSAPAVEIGRLAVDLLIRAMAGEAPEHLQHIVHPELVERGTHCKRP
jgi:DNA-binding LacI/PurR family transcriptional regulator